MSTYAATQAAKELGISRQALEQRLKGCGLKIGKGTRYTLRQIVDAMTSKDNDREGILKARRMKLEEEAMRERIARLKDEKELAPIGEIQEMIRSSFTPIRQRLDALPSEAASRCNPTDPEHARAALVQWRNAALSKIREDLPKANQEEE